MNRPKFAWFKRNLGRVTATAAASGIVTVVACYPGQPTDIGELDMVVTFYDTTRNYGINNSYFLFDSVFHIRDTANPADTVSISRAFDQQILALVNSNMQMLGYAPQDTSGGAQPDVLMAVSITASRNYQAYTFYPWWGYPGYPYWPCCLGGGWGWPTTVVSSYRVGSMFIDMVDVGESIAQDTVRVIWDGAINGLFEGTAAQTSERIDRTVNQAFVQSPYLQTN
jgi:hypothetical protein